MWKQVLRQWKHNYLAQLIGQLIVLLLCLTYIGYSYFVDIIPDKAIKQHFQSTTCFLTSKRLTSHGFFLFRRYRAEFLITYNVNGVQYNRWVSGNGLDNELTRNESEQEDLLSQFEVGRTYQCWYDADNPHISILVPRHNWVSIFPLMIPATIGVIALYFVLRSLFLLMPKRVPVSQKKQKRKVKKRK